MQHSECNIQVTIECGFTLKHVRDMIRTYSQMHRTDKDSQQSSIIQSMLAHILEKMYNLP